MAFLLIWFYDFFMQFFITGLIMSGWRDSWNNNWIVKNILSEIPIIGSFVSKGCNAQGVHEALKCTFMFGGGATAMMIGMSSTVEAQEIHNTGTRAKYLGEMALGMYAGKVIFNVLCPLVCESRTMLYQYCLKRKPNSSTTQPVEAELEALNKTDVHSESRTESGAAVVTARTAAARV